MERQDVLRLAEGYICKDRELEYGSPKENFSVIADFWSIYVKSINKGASICFTPYDVAVMMSLVKYGRIITGEPKPDTYIDCCGYLAIAAELATETEQQDIPIRCGAQ